MSRADRVAARLAERELDLLLVTDLVNVRYLTGFTGTNGLAIVGPDTRRFLTDFRYVERAKSEVGGFDLQPAPQELRAALAEGWPPGELRVGFEDQHVSVRRHGELRETLPDRLELVPAGGIVEAERAVKEPAEIAAIRAAAQLVDEIYDWVRERGLVGRTEREVALALEQEMRVRGAERPELPVDRRGRRERRAAARDAARRRDPGRHARDARHRRAARRLLLGLHADVGDRAARGRPRRRSTRLVLDAQETALDAVRPGPEGREIDAVARDLIAAAGHGEHFGHGLGHGVGLDIHEAPAARAHGRGAGWSRGTSSRSSRAIYVPGRGGARIEDLVVVTEDGRDVLSGTSKALTLVG